MNNPLTLLSGLCSEHKSSEHWAQAYYVPNCTCTILDHPIPSYIMKIQPPKWFS